MTLNPVAKYPKFQPNQALSDKHLNDLADYLLAQDLLTRAKTLGVGVLCGLSVSRLGNALTVSRGVALTSMGYLLHMPTNCTYEWVRPYVDAGVVIPALENLTAWELLASDPADDSDTQPLAASHWQNHAVVLALEISEVANDKCENDCVDRGNTVFMTPRPLLVAKDQLRRLIWHHLGEEGTPSEVQLRQALQSAYNVDDLRMQRPLLNSNHATSLQALSRPYHAVAEATFNDILDRLPLALRAFRHSLPAGADPQRLGLQVAQRVRQAIDASLADGGLHMQSVYDWLRHWVWAYNEWLDAAFDACEVCCPDPDGFPYHVMLDCATLQQTCPPPLYRHHFVPSPLHQGKGQGLSLATTLFQRLEACSQFQLPENGEMRLSPGGGFAGPLGAMPVPWYLDYQSAAPVWLPNWQRRCRRLQRQGYGAREAASHPAYQQPLHHSLDGESFLRLEGHVGRDLFTVTQFLDDARRSYNLPFETVSVRLGSIARDQMQKFCGYEDLRLHYRLTRKELLCALQGVGEYLAGLGRYEKSKPGGGLIFKPGERDYLPDLIEELTDPEKRQADFTWYQPFAAKHAAKTAIKPLKSRTKASMAFALAPSFDPVHLAEEHVVEEHRAFETGGLNMERPNRFAFNNELFVADGVGLVFPSVDDFTADSFAAPDADRLVQQLIGRLLELEDLLKADPFAFDPHAFQQQFVEMRTKAQALRDGLRVLLDSEAYKPKGFEQDLILVLGRLINACVFSRLAELMAAFAARRQQEQDAQYLQQFMLEHPGLEHRSGVERGGTLVLVYAEETAEDSPRRPDPQRDIFEAVDRKKLVEKYAKWYEKQGGQYKNARGSDPSGGAVWEPSTFPELADGGWQLNPVTLDIFFENFEKAFNQPLSKRRVVVADLSLPYLCCGGCSGTSYLVLTELMLDLEKLVFCKDDEQRYYFQTLPPGGRVRGPGVAVDEQGYFFRPADADVPLGEAIFVYERDVRNAILTVELRDALRADFTTTVLRHNEENARVRIEATANDADCFRWRFGDGQTGSGQVVEHDYDLAAGNRFEVVLFVGNAGCQIEVVHDVQIESTMFAAPFSAYCANQDVAVELTTIPAGGEVVGGEATVAQREDGVWVFRPSNLDLHGDTERELILTYAVDGQELGPLRLQIVAPPQPRFQFETAILDRGWRVTFHNLTETGASGYRWDFGDGQFQRTEDKASVEHIYNAAGNYRVILQAYIPLDQDRYCVGQVTHDLLLADEAEVSLGIAENLRDFCSTDASRYALAVAPAGGQVTGPARSVFSDGERWFFQPNQVAIAQPSGTQNVVLTYTLNNGSSARLPLTVYRPPAPEIGINQDWAAERETWQVTFANQTVGTADYYLWTFGDGVTRKTESPQAVARLLAPGEHKVTLAAVKAFPDGRTCSQSVTRAFVLVKPAVWAPEKLLDWLDQQSVQIDEILPKLETHIGRSALNFLDFYGYASEFASAFRDLAEDIRLDPEPLREGGFDAVMAELTISMLKESAQVLQQVENSTSHLRFQPTAPEYAVARLVWWLRHSPVRLTLQALNPRAEDLEQGSGLFEAYNLLAEQVAVIGGWNLRKLDVIPVDAETKTLVTEGLASVSERPVYGGLLSAIRGEARR